ncbi:MAG: hypothetical protein IAE90_01865 [Ignavibacteria bacterium]|nr:hypothetical protein [Ignavibacteria bacterium]
MELDIEALDSLSDTELAELAQRLRNEALAADLHAYALLGYLNDLRRGVNPANDSPETDHAPQAA